MHLSAVHRAARQEKWSAMEVAALVMGHGVRCSPQYVLSAAKILRYPLNHVETNQCIVAIAIAGSGQVDKTDLTSSHVQIG